MKKLLNTLYIMSENRYLSLDGENVVVLEKGEEIGRIPLHNLEGIVIFSYAGASPALLGACARKNISLAFLTPQGRYLASVTGKTKGNVVLRRKQYQTADGEAESLAVAKNFIVGKIYNCRWVLERTKRDHALQINTDTVGKVSMGLQQLARDILGCSCEEELRGKEGAAAAAYFSVFEEMILQQKNDFKFAGRNRRPPLDPVNALLSFTYTLLTNMTASALETVGLDPAVGFMHGERPGRNSLALDLMEELRPVLADRFVLTLINKRMVSPEDFMKKEDGAVLLTDEARKTVINEWQKRKQVEIQHPFLEEKLQWGMIPYAQAMLLARYLRGDLDAYPPFLWK